jgi:hypothetical protein
MTTMYAEGSYNVFLVPKNKWRHNKELRYSKG